MAAVLGRDFGYAPLAAALHTSPVSVVDALDPAVQAAVLLRDPVRQGGYRFSHVLIREAVVDAIGTARCAELHAVALTALRDTGWSVLSDLAHHAVQARMVIGDMSAAEFTSAAAEAADHTLAWEDAANWWQATLDLLAAPDNPQRQLTRMRLGHSLLRSGQVAAAREAFEQVARHAQTAGDDAVLAAAALAIGHWRDHRRSSGRFALDLALGRSVVPSWCGRGHPGEVAGAAGDGGLLVTRQPGRRETPERRSGRQRAARG